MTNILANVSLANIKKKLSEFGEFGESGESQKNSKNVTLVNASTCQKWIFFVEYSNALNSRPSGHYLILVEKIKIKFFIALK